MTNVQFPINIYDISSSKVDRGIYGSCLAADDGQFTFKYIVIPLLGGIHLLNIVWFFNWDLKEITPKPATAAM